MTTTNKPAPKCITEMCSRDAEWHIKDYKAYSGDMVQLGLCEFHHAYSIATYGQFHYATHNCAECGNIKGNN